MIIQNELTITIGTKLIYKWEWKHLEFISFVFNFAMTHESEQTTNVIQEEWIVMTKVMMSNWHTFQTICIYFNTESGRPISSMEDVQMTVFLLFVGKTIFVWVQRWDKDIISFPSLIEDIYLLNCSFSHWIIFFEIVHLLFMLCLLFSCIPNA